jgi:ABC-type transporter Mla subunit MlaD
MPNRGARNNILAGLFVVASLVLGVWVSFLLSDTTSIAGDTRFTVRFSLEDGATGLKKGSPVLLGGQQVGRVRTVGFAPAETDPAVATGIDVEVEVRGDLRLYENAGVFLQLPLLGTLSSINIVNIGSPVAGASTQGSSPEVERGEVVPGKLAPPAFLAQAGFGSQQAAQLRAALTSLEITVDRISKLMESGSPKIESSISDAQQLLAQLRERLAAWSERVDRTAANFEEASGRLNPMLTKVDTAVDGAVSLIADIRGMVTENREHLSQAVRNIESATAKLDRETVTQVNEAVEDGREALRVFSDSLGRLSAVVTEETPSLRRTLANLRLMSDQLKLTAVEVRSQPWRLLHQPTTKELSTQVLYDSTRAYAEAASDLRAASEALQAVSVNTGASDVSAMTQRLAEAMEKYRGAERALMDKLIETEGK